MTDKRRLVRDHLSAATALLFPEQRLAVFYKEKAGATSLLNWYHFQNGLSRLQKDSRTKFGAGVCELMIAKQNSASYQSALDDLRDSILAGPDGDWTTIKFVRDPYRRAVSSFFMVMMLREHELSFREFIHLPKSFFTKFGEGHARRQVTEIERAGILKFDRLYKVEDGLEKALQEIEVDFELKRSHDLSQYNSNRRGYRPEYSSDVQSADIVYSSQDIQSGVPLPPLESFLDIDTRLAIYHRYREDFEHYGYAHNIPSDDIANRSRNEQFETSDRMNRFLIDEHTSGVASLVDQIDDREQVVVYGTGPVILDLLFHTKLGQKNIAAVVEKETSIFHQRHVLFAGNFGLKLADENALSHLEYDRVLVTLTESGPTFDPVPSSVRHLEQLGVAHSKLLFKQVGPSFHPISFP